MEKIVFKRIEDIPPVSISSATMLWNKTGTWRYLRPMYISRIPPCNEACPAGNDIEGFMKLADEGRFEEALELIKIENPFPAICGRVCFHPCALSCNRREFDEALSIQAVERYIGDLKNTKKRFPTRNRKERIAVIGSGPAGLSCAYHLCMMGYEVTIFESHSSPGGILRIGIPEYRLPKNILDREISEIESLGVDIKLNTRIGVDIPFEELNKFHAIFIATGSHKSKRLNIEGEDFEGVLSGLEFLKGISEGKKIYLGKRVLVIGGGNVAIDVSRSSWRLGGEEVQMVCLEPRDEMPAFNEEISEAEAEGIKIITSSMPIRIIKDDGDRKRIDFIRVKLGEPKPDGSINPFPITGTEFSIIADTVILAIGELPDLSFLPKEIFINNGLIQVDETGLAHPRGYFAGGDVANPSRSVAGAIGSGKKVALAIHEYLQGSCLKDKLRFIKVGEKGAISIKKYLNPKEGEPNPSVISYKELNTDYFEHQTRISIPKLSLNNRKGIFKEIYQTMDMEMAIKEAGRCFHCGVCNGCDNCLVYCTDLAVKRRKDLYEIDYDYCKGCGICFEECPRGAIMLEEEGR